MDLNGPTIKNAVTAGFIMVIIALLFYLFNTKSLFSVSGWIVFVLYIVFMVRSVSQEKSLVDWMSFGAAFKAAFVTFVIASLMYTLFYFVLLNFIDPDLQDMQKDIAIDAIEKMSGFIGEEGTEAALEKIEDQNLNSPGRTLTTWAWGLIFPGAAISAIIGLIMKDKNPATA
jgi:predicted membrane protein